MKKVDLNVDIGEGFPFDEVLLEFATSANVCCGAHAGSTELTGLTIELCVSKGTRIGMHPGFPDRESLGRAVPADVDFSRFRESIRNQVENFLEMAVPAYVKPHGAWYNILCDWDLAQARPGLYGGCGGLLGGISMSLKIPAMIMPISRICAALNGVGQSVITEGFADRAYASTGALIPRAQSGAILEDPHEICRQVLELAPKVDSICLHGDTPGCLEFAELVRKTLEDAGYEVGY